jgi:hypothetical protein
MAKRLQTNHPRLFAQRALARRLVRLPGRLLRGEASMCGVMPLHSGVGLCVNQQPAAAR